MATTTNYSWTTPDDTALVKDGASAIRSLGTAIDTSVKNLNPATTLGDIQYRSSSANTNTRLGIGTTGQVLTVSGGVPAWAAPAAGGGMTLLSTTTLSGATTSITSINQSYKSLIVYIYGVTNATADGIFYGVPYNGSTSLAVTGVAPDGKSSGTTTLSSTVGTRLSANYYEATLDRTSANNFWEIKLPNYSSTTNYKGYQVIGGFVDTSGSSGTGRFILGSINSNSAVNRLDFLNGGGNLSTGTVLIYGVN